jgi:hypothetical protein
MTTKTIPEYLEDERQQRRDNQLRIGAEAARIEPLRHGHHRAAKQPELQLPAQIEVPQKKKITRTAARKTPGPARARKAATTARVIARQPRRMAS